MNKKNILFFLLCFLLTSLSAQTLEQAKSMYSKGEYAMAKPLFQKYVKSQPSNGNYNLWYGVCCLKTSHADEALKYLETAVKKRIPSGQLYLAQTYNDLYRFQDAIDCYESYIADLSRRKKPTEEAEQLLEKTKENFRMLKGVEDVCVIDSFVVNKADFLKVYKISEEAGTLYSYNDFFKTEGYHPGTVYETEIGNRVYYSEQKEEKMNIFSKTKMLDEWSQGKPLSKNINGSGNANYPYVLSDGVTIYYASDGDGSIGGYDIFVTRYNTNTDTYLLPENVGMPFNSPYNDYMYVVDEYNKLGWFASDRHQPEDKVCIYVFVPNHSKQTYNYEAMEPEKMVGLAKLHSLKSTWKSLKIVNDARKRLEAVINQKPNIEHHFDFEFIIDDQFTYHRLTDFKSPKAKQLYQRYEQMVKDYRLQAEKLKKLREQFSLSDKEKKSKMAPAIRDLEKRVYQMSGEVDKQAIEVRNSEKQNLK